MANARLLLADDSATIQKVISLTFTDEGVEVLTVGDGAAAIEQLSQDLPNVVLADVHMPGLNGYELCEKIKSDPRTSHLPVLLLVGSFEPFDETEAARVRANGHFTKPFQSIRQLVARVMELIESGRSTPAAVATEVVSASEAEPVPAGVNDVADIERLYQDSVARESGDERTPAAVDLDAGMDDEMIVTERPGGSGRSELAGDGFPENRSEYTEEVDPMAATARFDADQPKPAPWAAATATAPEPANVSGSVAPAGHGPLRLVETDLLEVPTLSEATGPFEITTEDRAAAAGGERLVTISPELIELIVTKVVERLTEKT